MFRMFRIPLLLVVEMMQHIGTVLRNPALLLYKWEFDISKLGGIWAPVSKYRIWIWNSSPYQYNYNTFVVLGDVRS